MIEKHTKAFIFLFKNNYKINVNGEEVVQGNG